MCAPISEPFSITHTPISVLLSAASCFRRIAAASPAGPPPTTTTSNCIDSRAIDSLFRFVRQIIMRAKEDPDGRQAAVAAEPGADRGGESHALRPTGDPRLETRVQRLPGVLPLDSRPPRAVLGFVVEVRGRARKRKGLAGAREWRPHARRALVPRRKAQLRREPAQAARCVHR